MIDSGLSTVRKRTATIIAELELTETTDGDKESRVEINEFGSRPGSYDIRRQLLDQNGHWCYSHKQRWAEVTAAIQ